MKRSSKVIKVKDGLFKSHYRLHQVYFAGESFKTHGETVIDIWPGDIIQVTAMTRHKGKPAIKIKHKAFRSIWNWTAAPKEHQDEK